MSTEEQMPTEERLVPAEERLPSPSIEEELSLDDQLSIEETFVGLGLSHDRQTVEFDKEKKKVSTTTFPPQRSEESQPPRKTPPPPPMRDRISNPVTVDSTGFLNSTVTLGVVLAIQGTLLAVVLAVAAMLWIRIGSLETRLESDISGLKLDLSAMRDSSRRLDERITGLENATIRAKEERARAFELLERIEKAVNR